MKVRTIVWLLTISACVAFRFSAYATEPTEDEPVQSSWKFRWGPVASIDLFTASKATKTGKPETDPGWGGSLGILGRYEWRRSWFVESALQLTYGWSPVKVRLPECEGYPAGSYVYDLQRCAIQLPVHGGYRFRITDNSGISLFVGALLSFGFAGDITHDDNARLPDFRLYGSDGVWRRFGTDFTFGMHFDLGRGTVGVTGNMGLTQMARRDIFTTRTMNESEVRIDFTYWLEAR